LSQERFSYTSFLEADFGVPMERFARVAGLDSSTFNRSPSSPMRHHLGWLLQLFVLSVLPVLVYWQLRNGFSLIWMPGLLTTGILIFWLGTRLRES
jgi:hypothetical protein